MNRSLPLIISVITSTWRSIVLRCTFAISEFSEAVTVETTSQHDTASRHQPTSFQKMPLLVQFDRFLFLHVVFVLLLSILFLFPLMNWWTMHNAPSSSGRVEHPSGEDTAGTGIPRLYDSSSSFLWIAPNLSAHHDATRTVADPTGIPVFRMSEDVLMCGFLGREFLRVLSILGISRDLPCIRRISPKKSEMIYPRVLDRDI